MSRRLARADLVIRRVCAIGAGASMAVLFAIIFVNALRRYTIGKSFAWGEELPIYLAIYGVMFGSALAYLQDRHVRFTLFVEFLSLRARNLLFAAIDLAVAATGGVLAWSGLLMIQRRGAVEAAGLIGPSRELAQRTGLGWIETFGHLGAWQAAICAGGILLVAASLVKFAIRLSAETDA